ncbi:MAG: hypothetical protein IKP55_06225 [Clostridia bacterium]|nr:hypothetical protein [Clostridia bacterium]
MKRIIGFISFGLLISVFLTGCNRNSVLPLQLVSIVGYDSEIPVETEYKQWVSGSYYDEQQPQNLQVEILGNVLNGSYAYSRIPDKSFLPNHRYKNTQSEIIEFEVDSEGNVVECYWNGSPPVNSEELSEEELIETAYNVATQITGSSLEGYTSSITYYDNLQLYMVFFTKYLNGIPTADHVRVVLYCDGSPVMFESVLFGDIPSKTKKIFDLEKVDQNVANRCDELTEKARKTYDSVEYSEWSHTLTIDEKGEYYVLTSVTITCKYAQGENDLENSIRLEFIQSI